LPAGYIANTFAASTIGLTYLGCDPFFWSGFLDDVSIYTTVAFTLNPLNIASDMSNAEHLCLSIKYGKEYPKF